MRGRTIAWVSIVAALVLWLSGPLIPGWLLAIAVAAAIFLGVIASRKQKRMERDFMGLGGAASPGGCDETAPMCGPTHSTEESD